MSEVPKQLSNPAAEMALLGSVLRANAEQRVQTMLRVREEWFTAAERVCAWRVIQDLVGRSLPLDVTLLDDGLRAHLPAHTRSALVEKLAGLMPTAGAWSALADRVENYYTRRGLHAACMAGAAAALDLNIPAEDALESVESDMFRLHAKKEGVGMQHVSKILPLALSSIMESIENRGYVTGGWPFGFTDLDRSYIKGQRPGHVIMIVSPPGGGKTVGLMKMAWNRSFGTGDYDEYHEALDWAMNGKMLSKDSNGVLFPGGPRLIKKHANYLPCEVGIYSWEMDGASLIERTLIQQSKVEMNKMHRGQISRAEQEAIRKAQERIISSRMYIDHVPGMSIQDFRVRVRYDVMRFGLKIIYVDYAQLITSSSKAARGNRTQEMMDVSKGLDMIAAECGVTLVVCAQPKQETWGQRAGLNAMAETAQLAKDADLVLMLGFWDKISKQVEGLEKKTKGDLMGEDDGFEDREADDPMVYAYMDIVKNRHGANTTGKPPIKLRWERDFYDFISTNRNLFENPKGVAMAS